VLSASTCYFTRVAREPGLGGATIAIAELDLIDQDWRAHALCGAVDPELFFAVGALEHRLAKSICRDCPVRRECLDYAISAPMNHGIWGGLTERERRRHRLTISGFWPAPAAGARPAAEL
jgi:WhiB family redox-sensing transcriptional regulator